MIIATSGNPAGHFALEMRTDIIVGMNRAIKPPRGILLDNVATMAPGVAKTHLRRFVLSNNHRTTDWNDGINLLQRAANAPGQEITVDPMRLEEGTDFGGGLHGVMVEIITNAVAHALALKATNANQGARFNWIVVGEGILTCA